LRHTAGARGVHQGRHVVWLQRGDAPGEIVGLGRADRQRLVPALDGHGRGRLGQRVDRDHMTHARHLRRRGEGPRRQRRGRDDDRAGAAVAEDVAMVVDRVGYIGRYRGRAGGNHREIGDDPFRPVLRDQHDPVAGFDAERDQPPRQPADGIGRRGPA